MKNINCVIAIGLLVLMAFSTLPAQENWGPAEVIIDVSGCDYFIANPSFYKSDSLCFEFSNWQHEPYKIFAGPLVSYGGLDVIPGDSINLDSIYYTSPFRSFDGDKLYFSSDKPGGYGGYDIWVSQWLGDRWGAPENLGSNINSQFHDLGPSLPLAENEIFFYRNEHDYVYDDEYYHGTIYQSENANGEWGEAEELPSIINASGHIVEPSISSDGLKLYFTGYYPDLSPHFFAYVSYRENDSWARPQLLNSNINTIYNGPPWWVDDGRVFSAAIDSSGLSLLYYYHYCPEGFMYGLLKISHLTVGIDDPVPIPQNIGFSAYPNPFNAQTTINFSLVEPSPVELSIYDIAGRLVETLHKGILQNGHHSINWAAEGLPSGVYFAKLAANNREIVKKLSLIK